MLSQDRYDYLWSVLSQGGPLRNQSTLTTAGKNFIGQLDHMIPFGNAAIFNRPLVTFRRFKEDLLIQTSCLSAGKNRNHLN